MTRSTLLAILVATVLPGCSGPTEPHSDVLSARAVTEGLDLFNRSTEYVAYLAMDRELAALADFIFCDHVLDPVAGCSAIAARGSTHITRAQISGYRAGAEVLVYHARLIRNPATGYYMRDSLRALIVATK